MRPLRLPPRLVTAMAWVVLLLACFAILRLEHVRNALPEPGSRIEGTFPRDGDTPHRKPPPPGFATWSSWAGSDDHRGSLVLGPFPASARLGFHVSGYPRIGGNTIRATLLATGETLPLSLENAGETWLPVRLDLPSSWHGQEITITVADDAAEWGGWIAVSQPFITPSWAKWAHGFTLRLAGMVLVLLTATLLVGAAARLLVSIHWVREDSVFLVPGAFAVVALSGYTLFWIGMASASTMRALGWCVVVLAAGIAAAPRLWWSKSLRVVREANSGRPPDENSARTRNDWFWCSIATVLCGLFVFAMLHLFDADRLQSDIARTRFSEPPLPSDNTIPQFMAARLLHGEPANAMFGDWRSSDRPPLQNGWILALIEPALAMGVDYDTAAQCAGLILQLLVVPAMWALLRWLGAARGVTAAAIFAVVPSGFFFINLTFVWPKMAGGAFVLLAFLLWFAPNAASSGVKRPHLAAGLLAGLGWLSHGGVAFAFLAAVPVVVWLCLRRAWRPWVASAVGFLALALPWSAYQKFYDPPGNRLVKWHLGGVIAPDERGTLETLTHAYRTRTIDDWLDSRRQNLRAIVHGRWKDLATFTFHDRQERRSDEFFHTLFSLGWWNAGFAALPFALLRRRAATATHALAARLLAWIAGTTAAWVALIYFGGHTVIHQGSYTTLIVLFPLLALALWRVHPLVFAGVGAAQGVTFVALWMTPTKDSLDQTILAGPFVVAGACALAAAALVRAAHRAGDGDEPAPG